MAYATVTQFKDAFPADATELTNLESECATTPIDSRIEEALNRASSEIDSYICSVISLPLTSTPLVLESKVLDIARYFLDSLQPRPDVRTRYDDAIEWLKGVASGEICLGVDNSGDAVSASTLITPVISACDRVFTSSSLAGY